MGLFQKKDNEKEVKDVSLTNDLDNNEDTVKTQKPKTTKKTTTKKTTTKKSVASKTSVKKDDNKSVCRVIVASPSRFVVQKNGEKIVVNELNNYKRGDEILF